MSKFIENACFVVVVAVLIAHDIPTSRYQSPRHHIPDDLNSD